jgi:hypothetical protein
MTIKLTPPRTLLEVFESLPEGTLCQLINNKLVMATSPFYPHQNLVKKIVGQLYLVELENKVRYNLPH